MIKAILWDADGVTIKKHSYFSDRISKEYGIPLEKIMPFFKNEFGLCSLGKADLKKEIAKYITDWNIDKTVEELLEWWFVGENQKDEQVLSVIETLRKQGIKCYLTTDQEKYRAEYILNEMMFRQYFDATFFSCDLGYSKNQVELFKEVINKIGNNPSDVLYWDDDEKNVNVAKELGILGEVYTSFDDFNKKMAEYIK